MWSGSSTASSAWISRAAGTWGAPVSASRSRDSWPSCRAATSRSTPLPARAARSRCGCPPRRGASLAERAPRCRVVNRRGDPRLFREARNRATEDVELRRSSGLEVDQEAGLHAGRQAIDYAHHARDLPLGEADAAGARDGNDFLDGASQQAPPQRIGAQRPDGGAGEPARRRYACKKHELLPQLHLDPIGRPGVHPGVSERAGDPIDPIADPPVELADDDDLKGTAPFDHPWGNPNRAD